MLALSEAHTRFIKKQALIWIKEILDWRLLIKKMFDLYVMSVYIQIQ